MVPWPACLCLDEHQELSLKSSGCDNFAMQTLRNARVLARFVLVWFAMVVGVAIASPLVKPQALQWVCSGAGLVKLLPSGDGEGDLVREHTLDCPLCASSGALPPTHHACVVQPREALTAVFLARPTHAALRTTAPLPPRGPPVIS